MAEAQAKRVYGGHTGRVGMVLQGFEPAAALALVVEAERLGIPAVWMTTGGIQPDALTLFAALATRTERIVLGTAIIPTWPRNPVFIAQQVLAFEGLAPGRLMLGIGPSTEAAMRPFGVPFRTPMRQLREYLTVLRTLLHDGAVDFTGTHLRARARLARPVETPVMASALQEGAFATCGELADGAISWVCPWRYVREHALPALQQAAAAAGREAPPVVLHVPIRVEEDRTLVREAAQRQIGAYGRFQFYNAMFRTAGYPDAGEGYSQELIDDLVVYGSEAEVARRLRERAAEGFGEVMAMPIIAGDDREASFRRGLTAIARANE